MNPTRDDEHDAWLREALRHAPDAQARPPSEVSARILREAQARARRGSMQWRPWAALAALWAALARPPVAAGFASLMVATLVGVMWWDRPMQDGAPRPRVSAPESIAPAPAQPAPVASDIATPPTVVAKSEAAPPRAATAKATNTAPSRRVREAAPPVLSQAAPTAAPTDAPIAADRAEKASAAEITGGVQQPAAMPAPAPAAAAQQRSDAAAIASTRLRFAPAAELKAADAAAAARAMAALRASIAQDAARWSWQVGSGGVRSLTNGVQSWLAQVDAAAASRWRDAAQRGTSAAPSSAGELRLMRDGRVLHVLRLDGDTLHWNGVAADGVSPSAFDAELPDASAALLRAALDDAAR